MSPGPKWLSKQEELLQREVWSKASSGVTSTGQGSEYTTTGQDYDTGNVVTNDDDDDVNDSSHW